MQVLRRMILTFVGITVTFTGGIFPAWAQNSVTPVPRPTPPGKFIIVNDGPLSSVDPHVSGDLVCYTNYSISNGLFSVHYFNLATQVDSAIPQQQTQDLLCDVRGSTITFTRVFLDGTQAIMQFDASSGGQPSEVAPLAKSLRDESNIGDQTIAWQDADFGPLLSDAKIVAYNRANGSTQVLTPATVPQVEERTPAVSPDGSVVVYLRCATRSSSQCSTWGANLFNGSWTAQQLVSEVQGNQTHPDTDGTIITYSANYLTNGIAGDHLVWQPAGGGTEQVLNAPGSLIFPSVSSGFIAFEVKGPTDGAYQTAIYDTANNVLYNVQADLMAAGVFPQIPGADSRLSDISVTPDGKARVMWQIQNPANVYAYTFNVGSDLTITKTGPQLAAPGSNIVYNLTVTNNGPQDATSVVVTDSLPPGATLVSCSSPLGTCSGTAAAPTIAFSSLANGSSVGATLIVTAPPSPNGTVLSNTASVTAAGIDPNPNNNSSTANTTLTAIYNICLLYDPTHAVKSGATIPIKISLCDSNGNDVSSSSIVVTAVSLVQVSTSTTDTIEDAGNSNPDNNFRFDPTLGVAGGYVFNLKTTGLGTGTYNLGFTAGSDPTVHTVSFQVK